MKIKNLSVYLFRECSNAAKIFLLSKLGMWMDNRVTHCVALQMSYNFNRQIVNTAGAAINRHLKQKLLLHNVVLTLLYSLG